VRELALGLHHVDVGRDDRGRAQLTLEGLLGGASNGFGGKLGIRRRFSLASEGLVRRSEGARSGDPDRAR
jgi:hypothetical protein